MGLFSSSQTTSSPPSPPTTTDGAFVAPTRSSRASCWHARDAFFACLDVHGIIDSVKEGEGKERAAKECGEEDKELGRECVASWVRTSFLDLDDIRETIPTSSGARRKAVG